MDSRTFQNDSDILSCKNFAFVDKVDDFQCVFCKGLYTKQFRLACTHFICRDCKYIKRKGCPSCKYSHEVEIKVAIVHIESEILKLRVRCLNDICGYVNTLKDFQDYHHKICKFSKFPTITSKSNDSILKPEDVKNNKTDNLEPKTEQTDRNVNADGNKPPATSAKLNSSATGPASFVKNQASRFGSTNSNIDNQFRIKVPGIVLGMNSFKRNDANLNNAGFIPKKAPKPLPKPRTKILANKSFLREDFSKAKEETNEALIANDNVTRNDEVQEVPTEQNNSLNELLLDKTNEKLEKDQAEKFEHFQNTIADQMENVKELTVSNSNFTFQKDNKLEHIEFKLSTTPKTILKSVLNSQKEINGEDKQIKTLIEENFQLSKENAEKQFPEPKFQNRLIEIHKNTSSSQIKISEQELFSSTITNQLLDLNNNQRDIFDRNLRFEDELKKLTTRYNKMEAMLMDYNSRIDTRIAPMRDQMEEVLAKVNQQEQINLELTRKIESKEPSFRIRNERMGEQFSPDLNNSESRMSIQQQNLQITTLEDSNELILQQLDEMKDDIKANSMIISMCIKRSEEEKQRMNEMSVDVTTSRESEEEIRRNLKQQKFEENQSAQHNSEVARRKSKMDSQLSQTELNFADLKQKVQDIANQVNANEEIMNELKLYVVSSDKSLAEESIVEIAKEVEAVNDRVNELHKQIKENILEIKEDYNEKVVSIKNRVNLTDPNQLIKPLEEAIMELRKEVHQSDLKTKQEELETNLNRHKTSFATMKQQVDNICNKVIANEASLNKFQLQVSSDINSTKENSSEIENEVDLVKQQMKEFPRQFSAKMERSILEITQVFENEAVKKGELEEKLANLMNILDESEKQTNFNCNNIENGLTNKFSQWSSDAIQLLKENQDRFKKQVLLQLKSNSSFSRIESHPFHTLVYVWEIPEIESKINQHTSILRSELFSLPGYSIMAYGVLENQCCQFRLDYYSENAPQADKAPFKKVHPKITCVLRDLSETETPKNVVRAVDCLRSKKLVHDKFDFGRFICSTEIANYVRNDAVVFEIHVETPSLAAKVFSSNGVLFDVIGSYGSKKRMAEEELEISQKSPYFYTSAEGYRVQVLMYLNAVGEYEGNGLTAAIRVLTGENDLTLPNSLTHTVTFTIYNQSNPTQHLIKCFDFDVKDENVYVDFESNDVLENEGFVKNDSLFYKVVIQKRILPVKKSKSAFKLFK